ncbi:MAG TPA: FGGY family carbohydrate kinase [Alphaproteobacteria bacterium]|nr:FGGY family carbohydrate kinase [Alphaproteobacteria bacterium]
MSSEEPLLLGIDVGTGSIRAALIDLDGRVRSFRACPHRPDHPAPGCSEGDPEGWWKSVAAVVRAALSASRINPRAIAGISVCGQMHAAVPIDGDGRVIVDRVPLWNDRRAATVVEAFAADPAAAAVSQDVANPPTAAWLAFKIAWLRRNLPEVYERATTFLAPKDFINYRLTGVRATDLSEASGSYLLTARALRYDPDIAGRLDIDLCKLPGIRASGEVIGAVSGKAAEETGLKPGTPVVAGGGDFLVSLLGSGITASGVGSDVTGTSNTIAVLADDPVLHAGVMNLHAAGDGWAPFAAVDCAGDGLRWAASLLDGGRRSFGEIDAVAAGCRAGSDGLLFLPHLGGDRFGGGGDLRAMFFGLSERHGKAHLYRAVMEGVAFAARCNIALLHAAGCRFGQVVLAGGGANGGTWRRIKADVYGLPVIVPEVTETGLIGNAILAAAGVGLCGSVAAAASRMVRVGAIVEPDPWAHDRYRQIASVFETVLDANRNGPGRFPCAGI